MENTLPKFNIAPENWPSQKERTVFQPPFFRGELLNCGVCMLFVVFFIQLRFCRSKCCFSIPPPSFTKNFRYLKWFGFPNHLLFGYLWGMGPFPVSISRFSIQRTYRWGFLHFGYLAPSPTSKSYGNPGLFRMTWVRFPPGCYMDV